MKTDVNALVIRIKAERQIVKSFIADFNAIKLRNRRDARLSGLSYAINKHKEIVDSLQAEIDEYNAQRGPKRRERTA